MSAPGLKGRNSSLRNYFGVGLIFVGSAIICFALILVVNLIRLRLQLGRWSVDPSTFHVTDMVSSVAVWLAIVGSGVAALFFGFRYVTPSQLS